MHNAGTKSISNFGINNIIPLERLFNKNIKDYEFEFIVHAEPIHIAHALDATYFPFIADNNYSDHPYAVLMGHLLNFYKNASYDKIKEYTNIVIILQILGLSMQTAQDKIPGINTITEATREKIQSLRSKDKNIISYLSRINRVARFREPFNKS